MQKQLAARSLDSNALSEERVRGPNKLVQGKEDWRRHKSGLSEEVQRREIGWFQINAAVVQRLKTELS